jgi:hypothetical protein
MALLQEAYNHGVGAASRRGSRSEGLGIPLLSLRESSDEHERGKNRTKWPPHIDLRRARIALDYTFTLDPGDVLRGLTRGICHRIKFINLDPAEPGSLSVLDPLTLSGRTCLSRGF